MTRPMDVVLRGTRLNAPRVISAQGTLDDAALAARIDALVAWLARTGIRRVASRLDNGPSWFVLDLALRDMGVEAAKRAALLLAGTGLRLSWRPAGLVLQGFFLGMLLPMMVVVGQLYIDSPMRLCNAYLLDDQERLGRWLIGLASLIAAAWLAHVAWRLVRR